MLILTEATPNPNTKRFLLPPGPAPRRALEYRAGQEAAPPAVARLLAIAEVSTVLVGDGFVAVSRASGNHDWAELSARIITEIVTSLEAAEAWAAETEKAIDPRSDTDLVSAQIIDVLAKHVAPQVARDGGDIEFLAFDHASGVVRVALKGACGGCPSAAMTLKNGVEAILKRYVPKVRSVRTEAKEKASSEPFWRKWFGPPKAA